MPLWIRSLLPIMSVVVASTLACSGGGSGSSSPAPAITSGLGVAAATVVVSDGQTAVTTVSATHPDPTETLIFSIGGGADGSSFSIDPSTGVLALNTSPTYANPTDADMDNVYQVRVVVTDSVGGTDVQTISTVVAFNVDTLADVVDGDLTVGNRSLREAIDFVFDGDAISFSPALSGQTLTLTAGQITITKNLMIDGDLDNDGAADITIDANSLDRIFEFDDGGGTPDLEIRLSGLTLTNGAATGPGGAILNRENLTVADCNLIANRTVISDSPGGAISSGPGDLTINGSNVIGNSTESSRSDGGGVSNIGGKLTLTSSVVAGNETFANGSSGGGIDSDGGNFNSSSRLIVLRSDIDGNIAAGGGGGINAERGSYTIEQSTIRNNESAHSGGGIYSVTNNSNQSGRITNSTIHGNRAGDDGGGLYIIFNRVRIANSTITSNTAGRRGGGINSDEFDPDFGSRTDLASSIVASNQPTDIDFDTFFTGRNGVRSRGGNVVGLGNAIGAFAASELIGGADPELESLDLYGGETRTRPPLASSPAIGAGRNPNRLSVDQRGEARTFGGKTDAGAVERNEMD